MDCSMDLSSKDSVLVTGEFEIDGISLLPGQSMVVQSYEESEVDAGLYELIVDDKIIILTGIKIDELKDKGKIVKIHY